MTCELRMHFSRNVNLLPHRVSPINPNVVGMYCANDDNYSESLYSLVSVSDASGLRRY